MNSNTLSLNAMDDQPIPEIVPPEAATQAAQAATQAAQAAATQAAQAATQAMQEATEASQGTGIAAASRPSTVWKNENRLFMGLSRDRPGSRFAVEARARNGQRTCGSFLAEYEKCKGCQTQVDATGHVVTPASCAPGCSACGGRLT